MLKKHNTILVLVAIAVVLLMTVLYQIKIKGELGNFAILLVIGCVTTVITIFVTSIYRMKEFDEMMAFKTVVPIIMVLFTIAIPVFMSHDEDAHWFRIYDITQGNFITSTEYGHYIQEGATNYPVVKIPKAVGEVLYKKYKGASNSDLYNIEINEDDEMLVEIVRTAVYSPTQYLPQALGAFIARIFTNKPIVIAYFARVMNILACYTILYFAMKFMPFGRKIPLVLMSIPIAIEGFTSLSGDGLTISISYLFIAYILNIAFKRKEDKLSLKQVILISIMAVALALSKIVYLPIVGLVLLLPKTKFKSKKNQIICIVAIMTIAIIVNLSWLAISSRYLTDFKQGMPQIQLHELFKNPLGYIQRLIYSIDLNGGWYFLSAFGGSIGLEELVKTNTIVPVTFFILTIIATFCGKEKYPKFSAYQTTIMLLIVLAVAGLIFTSLYIQWTNSEDTGIAGVQGRYFIPILPILMLILSNLKIKIDYSEAHVIKAIAIGILMIQIYVIPIAFCIRKFTF